MQQEPTHDYGTMWRPLDAFHGDAQYEYAMIVLNRPLDWRHDGLLHFWRKGQSMILCRLLFAIVRIASAVQFTLLIYMYLFM